MEHEDYAAEMGPGMDLMISLFALSMLVIALITMENQDLQAYALSSESVEIFEQNQATLTPEGRVRIGEALEVLYPVFRDSSANMVRLIGHADPKSRQLPGRSGAGLDGNVDLSAGRSVAVAHELHRRGVPYECMMIEAHGSMRSQRAVEAQDSLGVDRDRFVQYLDGDEAAGLDPEQAEGLRTLVAKLWEDRKVEIIPARDRNAPCTPEQLLESLRTAP